MAGQAGGGGSRPFGVAHVSSRGKSATGHARGEVASGRLIAGPGCLGRWGRSVCLGDHPRRWLAGRSSCNGAAGQQKKLPTSLLGSWAHLKHSARGGRCQGLEQRCYRPSPQRLSRSRSFQLTTAHCRRQVDELWSQGSGLHLDVGICQLIAPHAVRCEFRRAELRRAMPRKSLRP